MHPRAPSSAQNPARCEASQEGLLALQGLQAGANAEPRVPSGCPEGTAPVSLHVHIMKKGTVTDCSISHVGRVGGTEGSWTDGSALDCCVTLAESLSISGPGLTQPHSHSLSL